MKNISVFLFVLVLVFGVVGSANAAPTQWRIEDGGNDHWYEVIDLADPNGVTWNDAKSIAESEGGYLATLTSQSENEFVTSLLLSSSQAAFYWLGAYQDPPDTPNPNTNWKWVSNEPWSYTNWAPSEPNDLNPSDFESVLEIYGSTSDPGNEGVIGMWNDKAPNTYMLNDGYVVEYDIIPIPGAIWLLGCGLIWIVGLRKFRKDH